MLDKAVDAEFRLVAKVRREGRQLPVASLVLVRRDNPNLSYALGERAVCGPDDYPIEAVWSSAEELILACIEEKADAVGHEVIRFSTKAKTIVWHSRHDRYRGYSSTAKDADFVAHNRARLYKVKWTGGDGVPFAIIGSGKGKFPPTLYGDVESGPWIGAKQKEGKRTWFGYGYYAGEGYGTGRPGGFGYWEDDPNKPKVFRPEPIRDFSISAMLVEEDAIWLGVYQAGEWGAGNMALVRFDRSTEELAKRSLGSVITAIERRDGKLVLATYGGFAVEEKGGFAEYFVHPSAPRGPAILKR